MLKIQEWLQQNNFNYPLLETQLGITSNFHPSDDRVIESKTLKLNHPTIHKLSSQLEVEQYLKQLEQDKKLDEGFVLRDKNNNRIKCKSALYLRFHYIFSNGEPKTEKLLEFILNGEVDELLSYFPFYTLRVKNIKERAEKLFKELDNLWYCYHKEPNRKLFALGVKDHPLASVLFNLRDDKGEFKHLFNEAIMKKPHLLE